jgi:hypothetical protein
LGRTYDAYVPSNGMTDIYWGQTELVYNYAISEPNCNWYQFVLH